MESESGNGRHGVDARMAETRHVDLPDGSRNTGRTWADRRAQKEAEEFRTYEFKRMLNIMNLNNANGGSTRSLAHHTCKKRKLIKTPYMLLFFNYALLALQFSSSLQPSQESSQPLQGTGTWSATLATAVNLSGDHWSAINKKVWLGDRSVQ
jgi:hypothetical protein